MFVYISSTEVPSVSCIENMFYLLTLPFNPHFNLPLYPAWSWRALKAKDTSSSNSLSCFKKTVQSHPHDLWDMLSAYVQCLYQPTTSWSDFLQPGWFRSRIWYVEAQDFWNDGKLESSTLKALIIQLWGGKSEKICTWINCVGHHQVHLLTSWQSEHPKTP